MKINTTKIKRELAKKGIGNPLNQLLYDDNEIEEMKEKGLIGVKKPKVKKIAKWVIDNKGKYAVVVGKIIVHKAFETRAEAIKWRNWNYKDHSLRVIKL